MNTQLAETQRRLPVSAKDASTVIRRSRPPNPLERIALRIGITLIIWGRRRSNANPGRDELIRRYDSQAARELRERQYRRSWSLATPRL